MKRECPEWAAKIGGEVRLLTQEMHCVPQSIVSLLRQIDQSELAIKSTAISALLAEQRQCADQYRVLGKAIRELHNLMSARHVDPKDHAKMQADAIARTAEVMRLGRRLLELDAAVTVASLRPS